METFDSKHGKEMLYIIFLIFIYNILIGSVYFFTDNYILSIVLKVLLVMCNVNILYYLLLFLTVKYSIDNESVHIIGIFGLKKVTIPFKNIKGYNIKSGTIKGIKLSGVCRGNFALGRSVIDKIGITRMFVTNNDKIIYIFTDEMNYAVSPCDYDKFEKILKEHDVKVLLSQNKPREKFYLYNDKKFINLLVLISIIIIFMTLNPFILYLKHALPETMPLIFNQSFEPLVFGTSKQFAFKQMIYGALNMIILFCMYYASYFHAKYDRKSSYIYMYIILAISICFLAIQLKIIYISLI